MKKNLIQMLPVVAVLLAISSPAFAQDAVEKVSLGQGIGIGLAVLGGALAQGMAARAALEGIARNPSASGQILVPMILGLALIESLVLIGFLVAGGLV